jgi:hypothetical protein
MPSLLICKIEALRLLFGFFAIHRSICFYLFPMVMAFKKVYGHSTGLFCQVFGLNSRCYHSSGLYSSFLGTSINAITANSTKASSKYTFDILFFSE